MQARLDYLSVMGRRRAGRRLLFRRSPEVVCYWADGEFVFENYATRRRVAASPLACELLDLFDTWRPIESLSTRFPHATATELRRAVDTLAAASLLQRADRPDLRESSMAAWKTWNPAAGFFHFSTKDVAYETDLTASDRWLRRQARHDPMPPPTKSYRGAIQIKLPPPQTDGDLARALLTRRTWRQFSGRALSLEQLGTLLGLTWKVQRWIDLPGLGRVALKTSPSGGARHSIEAYIVALNVDGLRRGVYHYRADAHRLERLPHTTVPRAVSDFLPGQTWYRRAAALTLMTGVMSRARWKYPFARAYRAVLIEAGHLCQTFCLVATWLGLAPFCSLALADSRVESALGIDGITEPVLYAAGVGTRLAGVDWTPRPPTMRGRRGNRR